MRSIVFALLLCASAAHAAGINLAWDTCSGEGPRVVNKSFLCDTNSGTEMLVASFIVPAAAPQGVSRQELTFDVRTAGGAPLPVWWDYATLSSCRLGALGISVTAPTTLSVCRAMYTGALPTVVVIADRFRFPGPDEMQLGFSIGPTPVPLVPGTEYFSCLLQVTHAHSTGAGACAGCMDPVSIAFTQLRVQGAGSGAPDQFLTAPATGNVVQWQASGPTATRRRSWRAIKALYR
jgi:hypothetical protein